MYAGVPPWDIGRPQREFVRISSEGELQGKILDSGCGTGENSLYLASRGLQVVGVDFSNRALEKAKAKATLRKTKGEVRFILSDALNPSPELLKEVPFDTIIDSGLYHAFDGKDTDTYVSNLFRLLKPRGTYVVMCFSDLQEGDWGPRRVPKNEFAQKFTDGWKINYIKGVRFENNDPKLAGPLGARAWLASITKVN